MAMNTLNTINEIVEYIIKNYSNLDSNTQSTLLDLVNQAIIRVENSLNITIDANEIPRQYQPIIIDFSYANVLLFDANQEGTDNIKLGPLSVGDGTENKTEMSNTFMKNALNSLLDLKRRLRFKRVIGA